MDEKKQQVSTAGGTAAARFTAIVLREFNGLTGSNLGLTDFQKKLAQHLFVKVDVALKSFEAKRKGTAVAPYTWANINLDKLAVDAIYRIDLGLDALIPNHIHPVPYWNDREGKYDLDLRIGYVGKDYYHRKFAVDPPVTVVYELVYSTDKFKPIKTVDGSSKFEFEITQPFARGDVIGGFGYVIYDDPRKNFLIIVSEDTFLKSKELARSQEFWENYPIEMRLKTLVHRTTDKIPIDPQKTNKSYAAVEKEEEMIEGSYREIPTLEELPHFDSPTAKPKTPPPPLKKELTSGATLSEDDILKNHRSSIVELAQKHLGPEAYEKVIRPYLVATFNKQGISDLTKDELPVVDKWLAEQISQDISGKTAASSGEADKKTEAAEKSKPRGRPKKTDEKKAATSKRVAEELPKVIPQDQVRVVVKELKDKKWSDDAIKEILHKATISEKYPEGKKSGWDNNDVPAIRKAVQEKESKKTESDLNQTNDEVEKFLNEQKQGE